MGTINDAIDARIAADVGAEVKLSVGNFYLSETIKPNGKATGGANGIQGISLIGSGLNDSAMLTGGPATSRKGGTRLWLVNGSNCHVIVVNTAPGSYHMFNQIKNMMIDANKNGQGAGPWDGIVLDYTGGGFVCDWKVDNVWVDNAKRYGLRVVYCWGGQITNSVIENCGDSGFLLGNYQGYLSNCMSGFNDFHGFEMISAFDWQLVNCQARGNKQRGYYIWGSTSHDVILNGCYATGNSAGADNGYAEFQIGTAAPYTPYDITLIGCKSFGSLGVVKPAFSLAINSPKTIVIGFMGKSARRASNVNSITSGGSRIVGSYFEQGLDNQCETALSMNNGQVPTQERNLVKVTNSSGGNLVAGNTVVYKATATGYEITTTINQGDDLVAGMLAENIANTASGLMLVEGNTNLLKVDGTVDIAIGDFLCTHTNAGIAMKAGAGDMAFAIACEDYTDDDPNGVIKALLIKPRKL